MNKKAEMTPRGLWDADDRDVALVNGDRIDELRELLGGERDAATDAEVAAIAATLWDAGQGPETDDELADWVEMVQRRAEASSDDVDGKNDAASDGPTYPAKEPSVTQRDAQAAAAEGDSGQMGTAPATIAQSQGAGTSGRKWWAAGLSIAAVAAGLYLARGRKMTAKPEAWTGTVQWSQTVGNGEPGLELCGADGKDCATTANVTPKQPVAFRGRIKTDRRTRAWVTLEGGTKLSLGRDTEVWTPPGKGHVVKVVRGSVALVSPGSARVVLDVPDGEVTVGGASDKDGSPGAGDVAHEKASSRGARVEVQTSGLGTAVKVARGAVSVSDKKGRTGRAVSGQSVRLTALRAPLVAAAQFERTDLAPEPGSRAAATNGELNQEGESAESIGGLGELRAKKPGSTDERSDAVTLKGHRVKVSVVDGFARTEVEEEFFNNTDEVLEGIYRFPMPADAQIERLALEVDGKWEEGAFVDRDRAAKIWRGAIVNGGGKKMPKDEIIWVPGPWKDPALLEWQAGDRFELRIYPIAKRSSRRVRLVYTQLLPAIESVRRYVYPLPRDPSGSTRVANFDFEASVRGYDKRDGVAPIGSELSKSAGDNGTERLELHAKDFLPTGDLAFEFVSGAGNNRARGWGYLADRPDAPAPSASVVAAAEAASKNGTAGPTAPHAGYATIALRPEIDGLRSGSDVKPRAFVVAVDVSRSMVGSTYRRAVDIAERVVDEMDRQDVVTLMACDTVCRAAEGGFVSPGTDAAQKQVAFLRSEQPDGASDLAESLRHAAHYLRAADTNTDRAGRVVWIGDGTPTVGALRGQELELSAREVRTIHHATVLTVAVGSQADNRSLAAVSRGGGGVNLPYVPGKSAVRVALSVLSAAYNEPLSDVEIELPPAMVEAAPKHLPSIRSGGEVWLSARITDADVKGDVVVRGTMRGESVERRYPITLVASPDAGHAFAARTYAAARIADLEETGTAKDRGEAIALSQAFSVASRQTSLLVLESPAMFKAFGLNNQRKIADWDPSQMVVSENKRSANKSLDDAGEAAGKGGGSYRASGRSFGLDGLASKEDRDAPTAGFGDNQDFFEEPAKDKATASQPAFRPAPKPSPAPPPRPAKAPLVAACAPGDPMCGHEISVGGEAVKKQSAKRLPADVPGSGSRPNLRMDEVRSRRGRMVPMRRVWQREFRVTKLDSAPPKDLAQAERDASEALRDAPNSRKALRHLYEVLAAQGKVEDAADLSEQWVKRDALDPLGLTVRADAAARAGKRSEAIRRLGSVVDVRPDDVAGRLRLARLHEWAGQMARGCRYRVAVAQLRPSDLKRVAQAVRCAHATGHGTLARALEGQVAASNKDQFKRVQDGLREPADVASGEVKLSVTWDDKSGGHDLDVALVAPDGARLSWLGTPSSEFMTVKGAASLESETLGVLGSRSGRHLIEVVRARGKGRVTGTVTITGRGIHQSVPFALEGNQVSVGWLTVRFRQRLVPVQRWGGRRR